MSAERGVNVSFEIPDAPEAFADLRWDAELSERGLRRLVFSKVTKTKLSQPAVKLSHKQNRMLKKVKDALSARLNGAQDDLDWSDFDLEPAGSFHLRVWRELRKIPHGATATYRDVAESAGSPLAYRACGQACGANRILIFIPCHRVVASGGIGGFGYGLGWKRTFLELERGIDLLNAPLEKRIVNKPKTPRRYSPSSLRI